MAKFRCLGLVWLVCALLSCKKDDSATPNIIVENLYIKYVTANRVDITYELSQLGYSQTGVTFHKKASPLETSQVKALREDGILKLSLQGLEPNTEYVFKVFYKQKDNPHSDVKDYTVKTLTGTAEKYELKVADSLIVVDENGNFTANLVGENINNLNLSKLSIGMNNITLKLDYPIPLAGGKYKIVARGNIQSASDGYYFRGIYEGKDIFLQSVPFRLGIDRYWLTYKTSSLRGYEATVFNGELYYFYGGQVLQWSDSETRFKVIANGGMQDGIPSHAGLQFDDQVFFAATETPGDDMSYPQAGSFRPAGNAWTMFPLKEKRYPAGERKVTNSHLFIHKNELYLSFGIEDYFAVGVPKPPAYYLYRYNKTSREFKEVSKAEKLISAHRYISINEQIYLTGLVPVYDQGLELSSTFAIYRVNDQTFETEEIYRGGTVHEPVTFTTKQVFEVDQKILIALSLHEFLVFDPSNKQLFPVYLRNRITNMYFGGLFNYNNHLYLNADLVSNEQMVYEISIIKGP